MDQVGSGHRFAQAEHVGQVLGDLQDAPGGGMEAAGRGATIEELADPVSVRIRHRAVEEAAGQQLDLGAGADEGRRQGTVVGRRVRRGVDERNAHQRRLWWRLVEPDLSYCVVNTNGREYLLACLEAIDRAHPAGLGREIIVLDNASEDGSAEAVRSLDLGDCRLIALERRSGKAENDSTLLRAARGRYCLLLNEDSELLPGAPAALVEALEADPRAAAAGAQLLDPGGEAGALRVALPRRRHCPGRGSLPAPPADRAEPWLPDAASRLGAVERPAGPPGGGGGGRLPRPRLLRLLRRV